MSKDEFHPLQLLIVDDDRDLGSALAGEIEQMGHHAVWCETAAEGEVGLCTERFDIVLSDYQLRPPERGDRFLTRVRELAPEVGRIIYSGKRLDDVSFADAHIEKPCTVDEVLATAGRVLDRVRVRP